jgi:hypothetical protein
MRIASIWFNMFASQGQTCNLVLHVAVQQSLPQSLKKHQQVSSWTAQVPMPHMFSNPTFVAPQIISGFSTLPPATVQKYL